MKKAYLFILSLVASVLFNSFEAAAQSAAGFLNIDADARSAGMGSATSVTPITDYSHWNNVSGVSFSEEKFRIGVGYQKWHPSSSNVFSVGGFANLSRIVSLTAGFKYFTYPSIDVTDETGKITGSASPKDMVLGAGLSFKVIKNLSLSASLNYVMSDLAAEGAKKANCLSADFGATLKIKRFTVATTFSNIGSKVNYGGEDSYPLPANWKAGFRADIGSEKHSAGFMAQGGVYFDGGSPLASAGTEYIYNKLLAVRAGYSYSSDVFIPSHASVGLGIYFFGIKFDASYLIPTGNEPLKNTFLLSLSYGF